MSITMRLEAQCLNKPDKIFSRFPLVSFSLITSFADMSSSINVKADLASLDGDIQAMLEALWK